MTSRLFVLDQVKKQIEQQLIEAKVFATKNRHSSTSTDSPSYVDPDDENIDRDDDDDEENSIDFKSLFEEFNANSNECAFPSINSSQCLTNRHVYQFIDNQSDFMKISKKIEDELHKSNERMCTSIDLSKEIFDEVLRVDFVLLVSFRSTL